MVAVVVLGGLIVLLTLHELGHILAARYLGLKVFKVGFTLKPYPHVYVAATSPRTERERYISLMAGMSVTLVLFLLCGILGFLVVPGIYIAFAIQLTLETNPFYSDIVIVIASKSSKVLNMGSNQANFRAKLMQYQFSGSWYIHFMLWTLFILLCIRLNPLS